MGLASAGNLWVATMDNTVYEFTQSQLQNLSKNPKPTPAITITSSDFGFILGCAFDNSGDLWIADSKANGVHEISKSQLVAGGNITTAVSITSNSLASPGFPAFDSAGNPGSRAQTTIVVEFAAGDIGGSGSPTPAVIIAGSGVSEPGEMAFDQNGTLWVTNAGNNTHNGFQRTNSHHQVRQLRQ